MTAKEGSWRSRVGTAAFAGARVAPGMARTRRSRQGARPCGALMARNVPVYKWPEDGDLFLENKYILHLRTHTFSFSFFSGGWGGEEGGWAGHGLYWIEEDSVVEEAALGALLLYPNLGM